MYRQAWCALSAVVLLTAAQAHAQPLNVLFYGNSFTLGFGSSTSVNALFDQIAVAAGHPDPLVQSAAASGQDLNWHLNNNTNAIFTLIPPSQDWDFIVMQEHSTKLTRAYTGAPSFPASVDASKADAIGLYNVAAGRSADVVPVLYETWARGPGHAFYSGGSPLFTDASEMQAEVRDGYDALQQAINDDVGTDLALIAPVGDAWENANYDQLHANDLWHAQNRGTLLAALVIYGTVYDDPTTSDIDLSSILADLGLNAADGAFLTAAADQTLIPEPATAVLLGGICIAAGLRRTRRSH
ncbi:PEP-CTERM sorting domain-containing protein [Pirellulales bacterium]|nr:PEP-CTERM sorting domain-containing protein [Pirellulales bacterium]